MLSCILHDIVLLKQERRPILLYIAVFASAQPRLFLYEYALLRMKGSSFFLFLLFQLDLNIKE